jgi:hypothetical protein
MCCKGQEKQKGIHKFILFLFSSFLLFLSDGYRKRTKEQKNKRPMDV